jgi:hypothetical protein
VRRPDRTNVDSSSNDDPRNQRVRVPHFARAEFVAAPDRRRRLRYQLEQTRGGNDVVRDQYRTRDCFADVADHARGPTPDLVAEEAKRSNEARAHRTLSDDAALVSVTARDRPCLLDHVLATWKRHDQSGVVEVTAGSVPAPGGERLVEASVQANEVAAGAEGQPIEIDRRRTAHRAAALRPNIGSAASHPSFKSGTAGPTTHTTSSPICHAPW